MTEYPLTENPTRTVSLLREQAAILSLSLTAMKAWSAHFKMQLLQKRAIGYSKAS